MYLDPKIHMLLHQVYLNPRVRVSGGIDKPIVEYNITIKEKFSTMNMPWRDLTGQLWAKRG